MEKTGNSWEDRGDSFVKQPNKFYPLDIDYSSGGQAEEEEKAVSLQGIELDSSLHPAVQDLVRLFFDVESMKKAMMEFEVQLQGRLSRVFSLGVWSSLGCRLI